MLNNRACRVCGLLQDEPPWGEDGTIATFEICACCGVQFGYEDCTPATTRSYRAKWLADGARWFDARQAPSEWLLDVQLTNIPQGFR
jgi:hypothetical protein